MENLPKISSMNRIGDGPLGPAHSYMMFDHIKSAGLVQYTFIFTIVDNQKKVPLYMITSEVNAMAQTFGGGSHFLCVFDGPDHLNLGSSDEWGDIEKFFPRAFRMAAKRLGLKIAE